MKNLLFLQSVCCPPSDCLSLLLILFLVSSQWPQEWNIALSRHLEGNTLITQDRAGTDAVQSWLQQMQLENLEMKLTLDKTLVVIATTCILLGHIHHISFQII